MNTGVLIVDDEPDIVELLDITISRMGLQTMRAGNLSEAFAVLSNNQPALCLTDMKLPDGNGIDLINHIQLHHPSTPVAMITAFGSVETAINALKAGAFDFLSKPVDLERLRELISTALRLDPHLEQPNLKGIAQLVGESDQVRQLQKDILKLSRSQAPVYISGESGSGKEIVARLIHANGPRNNGPFIPVNCGAIPPELMESELFGHIKGSFTGAIENKAGLFQAARGGTLFLDEVADLPLDMQVKLLRTIQEKTLRPVGSTEEVNTDVRILSATHKDLDEEVEGGRFRNDLFYRINVIELHVPSLRERPSDIPLLAKHILQRIASDDSAPILSAEALEELCSYDFPGNVRELENILERALTLCDGEYISAPDVQPPSHRRPHERRPPALNMSASDAPPPQEALGRLDKYMADVERNILADAMEQARWNRTAAAKLLGISLRSLRYRLKKLHLED